VTPERAGTWAGTTCLGHDDVLGIGRYGKLSLTIEAEHVGVYFEQPMPHVQQHVCRHLQPLLAPPRLRVRGFRV
jgi:hypothetical protein